MERAESSQVRPCGPCRFAYIYAVAEKQSKSRALLEEALKLSNERQDIN